MIDTTVPATDKIFDQLRAIQEQYGYLPAARLEALSKSSLIPLYHLHGVADFYPHFHLTPPAKVRVEVCRDMSCHLRGGDLLLAQLKERYRGMPERELKIGGLSCLGQCDGAPAIAINDQVYANASMAQTDALVLGALGGVGMLPMHVESVPVPDVDPYLNGPRYGALRALMASRDFDGVIAKLKASGLSGLGGAGFPTGIKWEAVRKAPGNEKYVVCNADESEPGTIKDRFILTNLPHLVIEGMLICGLVTGARRAILYIRHEYHGQELILEEEIKRAREMGLMDEVELDIFVSPGGYICGEETALIEAIEGKRAEPRNKPPFPVTSGLWNKPTALNNVETFSNVPLVLLNGAYGPKFVGISGDVQNPGVFIIPMGTPASQVIFGQAGGILGGKRLKAWAPSGPSSGYLPASMIDVPLDFKALAAVGSMLGSGAIVVCAEGRCMVDMALNAVTFFRNESCGKCVPCRVGSQKMVDLLTGWTHGLGKAADLRLLDDLSEAMKLASICGLGQFAHAPITSVWQHFREEMEAHVLQHRCPEGVCPMRV
jgi:formate dehydrogenase/NADH-quinone oxidoreductase subunit F